MQNIKKIKEWILNKVSQYWIMIYYLRSYNKYGRKLPAGKNFSNPFLAEKQKTPSFNIYQVQDSDKWLYKDFATDDNGDCFDLVMKLYDLNFTEATNKIQEDIDSIIGYNEGIEYNNGNQQSVKSLPKLADQKSPVDYSIIHRLFNVKELKFWKRSGITQKTLTDFNVKAVKMFSSVSKDEKEYTIVSRSNKFIFEYNYGSGSKLYMPLDRKYRFLYLGEKPNLYVFGLNQLPWSGELLFITGGEKDVMSLSAHGFNAISFNSETSTPDRKLIEELKTKFTRVIILYDRDKTGFNQSIKFAKEYGLQKMILPPIANGGKDISDYFAEGGTKEEFEKLIPEKVDKLENTPSEKDYVSALDILNMPEDELAWLWEPYLPQTGVGGLIGSSDGGKSAFCRQLALAIITGEIEFLGSPLNPNTRSVFVVCSEDGRSDINRSLKMQVKGRKIPDECAINLNFFFDCDGIEQKLDKALAKNPASLVIMDTYGDLLEGRDMNSNTLVRSYLKKYRDLGQKYNCFFLFIHHVGKRTEGNLPSKHNAIGSQGFEGLCRIIIELRTDVDGCKLLTVVKGNYIGSQFKMQSFVLDFNEETLTFSSTGKMINLNGESVTEVISKKLKIDWHLIFGDDEVLRKKDIVDRLKERYSIASSTAARYIDNELIKVKFGNYRIRN